MKSQLLFLLLSFVFTQGFSQNSERNHDNTNVYHYGNNISVKNYDNSRSSIYISGNSARLFNPDGTQSSIDFIDNTANLILIDGTASTVTYNGASSTIVNTDGSQVVVNHRNQTSSCYVSFGKHNINHTFGRAKELKYKKHIDILLNMSWYMQKKAVADTDE